MAIALILIEIFFASLHGVLRCIKPDATYAPHWWVLRHPFRMVVAFLVMAVMAGGSGKMNGMEVREKFSKLTPDEAELATVLDGTILDDVLLVSTTERTATFLQVASWEKPCADPKGDCAPPYNVLVMDRTLVVCHAKGDVCKEQERKPSALEQGIAGRTAAASEMREQSQ